jgi:hypothetical protein
VRTPRPSTARPVGRPSAAGATSVCQTSSTGAGGGRFDGGSCGRAGAWRWARWEPVAAPGQAGPGAARRRRVRRREW